MIALAAPFVAAAVLESMAPTWVGRPGIAAGLMAGAIAVLAFAGDWPEVRDRRLAWMESLALALAAALAPPPWPWVLSTAAVAAVATTVLPRDGAWPLTLARRVAWAAKCAALAAVVVAAATAGVTALDLVVDRISWLATPLATILRALGLDAAAVEGTLVVATLRDVAHVPISLGNVGAYALASLLAGYFAIRILAGVRPSWRGAAVVTGVFLIGVGARLVLSLALAFQSELYVDFDAPNRPVALLAQPLFQVLLASLVTVPLLLSRRTCVASGAGRPLQRPVRAAAIVAAVGAVAGFLFAFEEGGARKPGRVMIDEAHSEWEAVTPAYDTSWYGFDSGYNYAAIADYLRHYYQVSVNHDRIDATTFRDVDVLMLKVPTKPYARDELDAIVRFARSGGGVFLVGEHTNVWGSGYYLNELARRLGFEFRYDVVLDLRRTFEQLYRPPRLGRHPIVGGFRDFLFEVGCSILPWSLQVRPAMWAGGIWTLDIDYAVSNFYPSPDLTFDSEIGPRIQCVARHYGRGRIAGFTDSTVWSNFSAMLPGKPELLLGAIEWLNRRNRWFDLFGAACVLLMLLALGVSVLSWSRPGAAALLIATAVVGGLAGARGAERVTTRAYPPPLPDTALRQVCFVEDTTVYELPSWGFIDEPDRSYAIFFQWVLRLGYAPVSIHDEDPLPPRARMLVSICSSGGVRPGVGKTMDRALAAGKPVLLLVRAEADTALNRWLARHRMRIEAVPPHETPGFGLAGGSGRWHLPWETQHRLSGGTPILEDGDGVALLARAPAQPLYVFLGGERFADAWMGREQGNVPDSGLRHKFELEFSLLRGLVEDRLVDELRAGASRAPVVRISSDAGQAAPLDRPGAHHHAEP